MTRTRTRPLGFQGIRISGSGIGSEAYDSGPCSVRAQKSEDTQDGGIMTIILDWRMVTTLPKYTPWMILGTITETTDTKLEIEVNVCFSLHALIKMLICLRFEILPQGSTHLWPDQ